MNTPIRLLRDPVGDGPSNMARDEALLLSVGERASPPTLRFYEWSTPTLSLGYFQRYSDCRSLPPPAGDLPVVRRLSGGGAILHDLELTYSLAVPLDHRLLGDGPNYLYEVVHSALIAVLSQLNVCSDRCGQTREKGQRGGPFFCFARRHCLDVLIDGRKVAGSAQRRTQQAVLQHGSIMLGRRFDQQDSASLEDHGRVTSTDLSEWLVNELARREGLCVTPGEWDHEELDRATELTAKYAGAEWTERT